MHISRVERELSHKIYVGGYESISPTVRLFATLSSDENPEDALKLIDSQIEGMWYREVIKELRLVIKRRTVVPVKDDKSPQLLGVFKSVLVDTK